MDNKHSFLVEATINGTPIGSEEIMYYMTNRDYENNRYPVRVMSLALVHTSYTKIIQGATPDKPYVNVNIKVTHIERKDDGGTVIQKPIETKSYRGIIDKTVPVRDVGADDDKLEQVYRLRVALFDDLDLNAFSGGTISGMFSGTSATKMIPYAFEACRASSKLSLAASTPDNKKTIKSLAIKPMGFLQFMEFIDKEYGVYSSRYNIYIEDNVVYLLNTQKSDSGMSNILPDPKMGKITINVMDNSVQVPGLYGFNIIDGHYKYDIFNNNCIIDDISSENIVQPTIVTVNSDGTHSKKESGGFDHISSEIIVEDGRNRSVTKSYRNPKFSTTVSIQELPIKIYPFTVVRYLYNQMVGDCMVSSVSEVYSHNSYVCTLKLKSYDALMPNNLETSKAGKNVGRTESK